MIRVNLIPPEILFERRRERRRARVIVACTVLMAFALAGYGWLAAATWQQREELISLQHQREVLKAEVARFSPYNQLQAEVSARAGHLKNAMGTQPAWQHVMKSLGAAIPSNVWLTDFTASYLPSDSKNAKAAGQVLIRGWTYDHPSVARWLSSLYEVSLLTDVRCVFSSVEYYQGEDLIQFEIRATLLPGEQYDPFVRRAE